MYLTRSRCGGSRGCSDSGLSSKNGIEPEKLGESELQKDIRETIETLEGSYKSCILRKLQDSEDFA
jgi:hypothetical protein